MTIVVFPLIRFWFNSCDVKLCEEFWCQKLLKSDNYSSTYIASNMSGSFFLKHGVAAAMKGCHCVQLYQWWMDGKTYVELTRPWYAKAVGFPLSLYWPPRKQSSCRARLLAQFGSSCISESEIETLVRLLLCLLAHCKNILSKNIFEQFTG